MNRTIRRCTTALVLALAVLLVSGSAAYASTTVLTDPTGDATICDNHADVQPGLSNFCPDVGSDPTVDIVSASMGTSASAEVIAEMQLLDLDDPLRFQGKDTLYTFATWLGGGATIIQLDAVRRGDAIGGSIRMAGDGTITVLTPVAFDFTANTVRWELTLARLNQLLDTACPTCADVAIGTDLTYFLLQGRASQLSVYANGPTGNETSGALVVKRDLAWGEVVYEIGS